MKHAFLLALFLASCATAGKPSDLANAACASQTYLLRNGFSAADYSDRLYGVRREADKFVVIYRVNAETRLFNCVDVSNDLQSVYVHEANCLVRRDVERISARSLDCNEHT